MSFEFDDSVLKELNDRIQSLSGEFEFSELFTKSFMQKHSKFSSFYDLLNNSKWTVKSQEDFKAIPDEDFDEYISSVTSFDSWGDMLSTAGTLYAQKN